MKAQSRRLMVLLCFLAGAWLGSAWQDSQPLPVIADAPEAMLDGAMAEVFGAPGVGALPAVHPLLVPLGAEVYLPVVTTP